ncbi:glycoside hydrolase family 97 N-terminal domain-containing protein [Streptomyces sp. NPDC051636]|uniref:glycoside hydrolase family 97 N-terminal domain-containing protein n=1 Tax=Streptomyces sp. NPDC051636 TaxID=3365663 RepID=UPI0037943CA7
MPLSTLRYRLTSIASVILAVPAFTLVAPVAWASASTAAATGWTVNGPSSTSPISAQVTLDSGSLRFGVQDRGASVLSPSSIGIVTSAGDFSGDLSFTGRSDRTVTESYTMTTGKRRDVQDTFNETTLSFTGTGRARMDLVVRVSDEGAAYRYVLPSSGMITVNRETSSWTVPSSASAWMQPYASDNQGKWFQTTAAGAPSGDYGYGALFNVNGNYALILRQGDHQHPLAQLLGVTRTNLSNHFQDGHRLLDLHRIAVTPLPGSPARTLEQLHFRLPDEDHPEDQP